MTNITLGPGSVRCQHAVTIAMYHTVISCALAAHYHYSSLIGRSYNTSISTIMVNINSSCFDVPGKGFFSTFQSPPVSPLVKSPPSLPSTPTSPSSPAAPGPRGGKSPFAKFRQLEDSAAPGPGSGSRCSHYLFIFSKGQRWNCEQNRTDINDVVCVGAVLWTLYHASIKSQ